MAMSQPVHQPQMPRPSPFPARGPIATPAASMPMAAPGNNISRAFEQQNKRNMTIAIALGCLAALLAGGLALKSMGAFGADVRKPDANALFAQGRRPNNAALIAPGNAPASPLAAPGDKGIEMPDDIYNWLEHLRKSEEKRTEITISQLTTAYTEKEKSQVAGGVDALKDLLNGIDDPNSEMQPPTVGLAKIVKQMHDQCHDVLDYFDSMPPPTECIPIRDAYDQAVNEEVAQMGDIADHLAAGDVDKLLKMEGKSAQGIDSAGEKTDRLVGEICDKYHKRRWFTIASDIKSSPLFGSGF